MAQQPRYGQQTQQKPKQPQMSQQQMYDTAKQMYEKQNGVGTYDPNGASARQFGINAIGGSQQNMQPKYTDFPGFNMGQQGQPQVSQFQMPTFNDLFSGMMNGFGFDAGKYISDQQSAIDARVNQYLQEQNAYYDKLGNQLNSQYNAQKSEMENAYKEQEENIDAQTYQELERSKAMGSMRGMTSSAQQVGMDSAVHRASGEAFSANARGRQDSLQKLSNQLNSARDQLAGQYEGAIKNSQNMKESMIGEARKEATAMQNQLTQMAFQGALSQDNFNKGAYKDWMMQQAGFGQQEKMFNLGLEGDLTKMDKSHGYDLDKMDKSHGYDLDKMDRSHGYDLEKMDKSHGYDLDKMAKAHGYDLDKMAKQQGYDLEKIVANLNGQRQNMLDNWAREDKEKQDYVQQMFDKEMMGVIIDIAGADNARQIATTGKGQTGSQLANTMQDHWKAYLNGESIGYGGNNGLKSQFSYPAPTPQDIMSFFGGTSNPYVTPNSNVPAYQQGRMSPNDTWNKNNW